MDIDKLHRSYLLISDPSEYKFACKNFPSWKAYEDFISEEPYRTLIESWRRELSAKIQSEALDKIFSTAFSESKDSLQASKFILDKYSEGTSKRGRPSKEEIAKRTSEIVSSTDTINSDFLRLLGNGTSN